MIVFKKFGSTDHYQAEGGSGTFADRPSPGATHPPAGSATGSSSRNRRSNTTINPIAGSAANTQIA